MLITHLADKLLDPLNSLSTVNNVEDWVEHCRKLLHPEQYLSVPSILAALWAFVSLPLILDMPSAIAFRA